jgi:hypothetical protein
MASLVKDVRSPFFWARFRDLNGREFTRSTREKDRERALEVALQMENQAREASALESTVLSPPIFLLPDNYSQTHAPYPETRSISAEMEHFVATLPLLPEETHQYYEEISRRFIAFLGPELSHHPTAALAPENIKNYRLFRFNSGLPQKSINADLNFLHSAFQSALLEGRISQVSSSARRLALIKFEGCSGHVTSSHEATNGGVSLRRPFGLVLLFHHLSVSESRIFSLIAICQPWFSLLTRRQAEARHIPFHRY